MSMSYDIKRICIDAEEDYGLTKEQCAELYANIIGAVEWELETQIDGEWTNEKYLAACYKELFG